MKRTRKPASLTLTERSDSNTTKALKAKVIEFLSEVPLPMYGHQKAGVPKSTYYKWRNTDPSFREDTDEAIIQGCLRMNDVAKSQLFQLINQGKLGAIIFWLKHNDPMFNSKIILEMKHEHELDPAQLALLARAMQNAGFDGIKTKHKELAKAFHALSEDGDMEDMQALEEFKQEELLESKYTRRAYTPTNPLKKLEGQKRRGGVDIAEFMKKRRDN